MELIEHAHLERTFRASCAPNSGDVSRIVKVNTIAQDYAVTTIQA